jgi:hypothetical protein
LWNFELKLVGLVIILVLNSLEFARILENAADCFKVLKPASLKFAKFAMLVLSKGKTSRCAGVTTDSSVFF